LYVSAAAYHTDSLQTLSVLLSGALRFVVYVGGMEAGERADGLAQQDRRIARLDIVGKLTDALVAQAFIQALGVGVARRDALDPPLASAKSVFCTAKR
jgi:hypothetical protein